MSYLDKLAPLALALPLLAGCGRTAPFNTLDKAPMTILRLGQQPAAPAAIPGAPAAGGSLIPGLPAIPGMPDLSQVGAQLGGLLPPGLLPPGLIPGLPATPATTPAAQQLPTFKGFAIIAQPTQASDDLRSEILDIFGHEGHFSTNKGSCFTPGLGVSIARPNGAPVELLISLSCNQAMGDGFQWPYKSNGFTTETHDRLGQVYQKLFGAIPSGA